MHELFLLLLFALTPLEAEARTLPAEEIAAAGARIDPCAAARVITEQGACTRPEDCGAFDGWMRLFGEPRPEPLDPRLGRRSIHPRTYLCPATSARVARRGSGR